MATHCCELGRIVEGRRKQDALVAVGDHFTANAFQGESVRPRFVLQIRRHVTSYADLSEAERRELGRALALLSQAVEREPGVKRVYVLSFNETEPGHLHWHILPRFTDEEGPYGPSLADLAEPPAGFDRDRVLRAVGSVNMQDVAAGRLDALAHGAAPVDADADLALPTAAEPRKRRPVLDSPLTDGIRSALELWNRRFSAYRPFRKLVRPGQDSGELYVLTNLAVLLVLLAISCLLPLPGFLAVIISVLAAYRAVDIVVYALTIVLMTRRSNLRSVARSIVLFALNLLELTLIGAIVLVSVQGSADAALWALGIGEPATGSLVPGVILRLQSLATFVVMGLALATMLSKVSDSFEDDSMTLHDWIRSR